MAGHDYYLYHLDIEDNWPLKALEVLRPCSYLKDSWTLWAIERAPGYLEHLGT